ncbi:MAG: ATP-binding cassette domain-containing protein [Acidobacteria bacterium]|nr:ATP-binding cassette domain-containing protein [Acidobacteriota bacterium]
MISFKDVSLIYPNAQRTILEELNFEVFEGELVLVIGHTGAGKSSLIKLINGLVPHHTGGILTGEITVAGRSTRALKPGQLADVIGIVGQNPINGFVTDIVEEEIAFGLETMGIAPDVMRKRVEEVLDLLSLAPLRNREIATLSGGEQQRVAIGAALVLNPKVLLLDEPTSALDPIAAEEVLSILHRLVHDLGLTVILAEHRLERVIQFADRIMRIGDGGEVLIGTPAEILAHSPIAPPIVNLSKALKLPDISLSVRDIRRRTESIKHVLENLSLPEQSPINSNEVLLSMQKVSVKYGENVALTNITFEIKKGEVVALMGRNGAGKSSLLKSAVAASPLISGTVRIGGANPEQLSGKELIRKVGFVPQEPGDLLYGQSVHEECELADKDNAVSIGTTQAIYENLMEIPNLSAHPRDLSEGQRLGLALSVILSANPDLVILDEPTRGLDYVAKSKLVKILQTLVMDSKESKSVVIATHDVELVAEVAERVIFLADGEIVANGPTREVLTSSPAFAPQVAKVFAPTGWLTVAEIVAALDRNTK